MTVLSETQAESQTSSDPAPPDVAEHNESASLALRMLATLPHNQQEVLRLKFQNGLSYREISRATNLTISNVGFLIHNGIKTLRRKLDQDAHLAGAQS